MIIDTIEELDRGGLRFDKALAIAERIVDMFDAGEFDVCTVVYNHFKSVVSQQVTVQQLVPYGVADNGATDEDATAGAASDDVRAIYEYEPDEEEILADLLPRNLAIQIYRGLMESSRANRRRA